jgi:hypothetical protein
MLQDHLNWELNYRAEVGLDLGFFHDKIQFSVNVYRSWTKDQLIYSLPDRGIRNSSRFTVEPADVLNEGLEFEVRANDLRLGPVRWSSGLALTVPRNVLRRFAGLDSTPFASTLVVGKSLSVTRAYHLTGVDPQTGLYTFRDVSSAGVAGPNALVPGPSLDAKLFAGWSNVFVFGHWQVSILLDWQRQNGANPLATLAGQNPPGFQNPVQLSNGPVEWLQRWQKPGDHRSQQRLTTGADPAALGALLFYLRSDGQVRDASYLRVKNVVVGYRWGAEQLKKRHGVEGMGVWLRGMNLWTVSRYPVTDAETQDAYGLPVMRVVTVGVGVSFR